jgi:hypothetical protein
VLFLIRLSTLQMHLAALFQGQAAVKRSR